MRWSSQLAGVSRGAGTTALVAIAVAFGTAAGAALALTGLDAVHRDVAALGVGARSAATVLATLAAYLFLRRARRTGAVVDVVATASITLLALTAALLAVLGGTSPVQGEVALQGPLSVGSGLVVSAGFVFAAFAGDRPLADPARYAERLLGWGIALALAAVALLLLTIHVAAGNSGMIVGNLLAACLWAVAAARFGSRFRAEGAQIALLWLAVAAALIGSAQLADALLPWSRAHDVSSGDLVQIAGTLALLVAGIRDFEFESRQRAKVAVDDERRRLARDLHDGLAQELAFIASRASDRELAAAAERALEESRATILTLARPAGEPLERLITDAAYSIGARAGVDVTVAVRPGVDAPTAVREALLRILRESMGNAIRHGRAGTIRVSLDGPSPLVMVVADDGTGFDAAGPRRPDSLGLASMRERAENVGGRITVESSVGEGTSVAVVVP